MTRLSRRLPLGQRVPGVASLACRSLLFGAMGPLSSGCLDAPPTYSAPVQSPPIILGSQVDPSTVAVQTIILTNPVTPKTLTVPFRSIDVEDLVAVLFVDYDPSQPQQTISDNQWFDARARLPADPRPLDEQDRAVTYAWDPSPSRFHGCHTITMQLAHESTFPVDPTTGKFQPGKLPATNQFDIAQVTWFFDVREPNAPPQAACWGGP